jgi:hypothetical protein
MIAYLATDRGKESQNSSLVWELMLAEKFKILLTLFHGRLKYHYVAMFPPTMRPARLASV